MSTMSSNQNDSALIQTQYTEETEVDEHSFIQELKSLSWEHYFYQKDMMHFHSGFQMIITEHFLKTLPPKFDLYDRHGGPIIEAKDLVGVKHYSGPELNRIAKSFHRLICNTMFGRLYEGTIVEESRVRDVIVKTWNFPYLSRYPATFAHHTTRLCDELSLLRDPEIKSHPNVVKLIGFHCDRGLAVVYEGGQKELLHSMLASDEFLWNYRKEVAIGIAGLLKTFHDKNLVHGGVNSVNILVDKAYRPAVFDFNCYSYLENFEELYIPHVRKQYYFHAKWLEGKPQLVYSNFKPANFLLDGNTIRLCDLASISFEGNELLTETPPYIEDDFEQVHGKGKSLAPSGDIYKFGKFMILLLTKEPIEEPGVDGGMIVVKNLGEKIARKLEVMKFSDLIRQHLLIDNCLKDVEKVLDLAILCLHQNSINRPTASEIVDTLRRVQEHLQTDLPST